MKTLKIVAALAVMAVPNTSFAAALANNMDIQLQPLKKASAPLIEAAANSLDGQIASDSMMVPTLDQLNDQIDKSQTEQKEPLPNFKIPKSSKTIIKKLPSDLNKRKARASKKGNENLKSTDFTGSAEKGKNINVPSRETPSATNTGAIDPEYIYNENDKTKAFQMTVKSKPEGKPVVKELDVLSLASRAYAVGQYESAIALYKAALQKDPNSRNALFGIATSYHRAGQKPQAKVYYGKLLDLYPYDTEGQNNFLTLVSEEAPKEALMELDNLARANPKYGAIHAQKAMIYIKMNDDEQAIKSLYQALQLDPDDNNYKYNLAVLFDKNGYYENAVVLYNDLINQSRRGAVIPANKTALTDRMTYIKSKIKNSNNEKKPI